MGITEVFADGVHWITPTVQGLVDDGIISPFILKWFHGTTMAAVLTTVVPTGMYLGWKIRSGQGGSKFMGMAARDIHPKLMHLASFVFTLGGATGLVSLSAQGRPILESPHVTTAAIGLALLAVQTILPIFFDRSEVVARTLHAYLGTATVALLFVHAGLGLALGLSF